MPENSEAPVDQIPPEAYARVKRENETIRQQLADAAPALKQALVIDQLHTHFKGVDELKNRDLYELAKTAAQLPQVRDSDDPAKAADAWIATMSNLFTNGVQAVPLPPMAVGANPAAAGVAVETGPFKVGSKEYNDFLAQHGIQATLQAVRDNRFFFSSENQAAQETASLIR